MTGITELVFVLDKSGSMGGLEQDTIGGYNAMLKKQQAEPGQARITTVLFDNNYELLHDRLDLQAVSPITDADYYVGGSTALLDAIGITINKIANAQERSKEEFRADKVLFIITTDGMENASREFTYDKIKKLIERQKEEFGWEFIFLGANIDAVEVAGHMGIDPCMAKSYYADGQGVRDAFVRFSIAVDKVRAGEKLHETGWDEEIDEEFEKRKNE